MIPGVGSSLWAPPFTDGWGANFFIECHAATFGAKWPSLTVTGKIGEGCHASIQLL
jgi:hypothetical protein